MKIQSKIFIGFLCLLAGFLAVTAGVALYNQRLLYGSIARAGAIHEEIKAVSKLSSLAGEILLPVKKYIRTGKREYENEFQRASDEAQGLIIDMARSHYSNGQEPDAALVSEEERLLASISAALSGIRDVSAGIFAIKRPGQNATAARMAKKMEKIWTDSIHGPLKEWHKIEIRELAANTAALEGTWRDSWKIMSVAYLILILIGLSLSRVLSGLITAPIRGIKKQVEDITEGRRTDHIEVPRGNEFEGLAKAFNAMRNSLGETCERLERSAERYRLLIHTTPAAVFLMNAQAHTIIEANDAAETLTGYSREELLRLSIDNLHPTCFEGDCADIFTLASQGQKEERQNAIIKKKNDELVPVDITASRVETEDGGFILCFMRDISERAALEKVRSDYTVELESKVNERTSELERSVINIESSKKAVMDLLGEVETSKKVWEDTFDSIPDPIFIHDEQLSVVKCNIAYQRAAGLPFQNIVGRPYYEVYPVMDSPFALCDKEKSGFCRVEQQEISLGENRTFRLRYIPIRDSLGKFTHSLHLMEDITGEKNNLIRIKYEVAVNRQLLKIAEATAKTTNIDMLLKEIVACVKDILSADVVAAYLGEEDTKTFIPRESAGIERMNQPVFKNSPVDGTSHLIIRALETGEVALIQRASPAMFHRAFHGNKFIESIDGLASVAIIPITYRGAYLGLILAAYKDDNVKSGGLSERDIDLMRGFAGQASVAIDEARLYKESINRTMDLSRKIMTIRMLNEIDRSILSAVSADEILETAARMISRLVQCDGADVWIVRENRIVYTAGHGHTLANRGMSFETDKTIFSRVINEFMPFTSPDTDEITNPQGIEKHFLKKGLRSVIIIPLTVKNEIKGMLNVCSRRPSAFGSEDLSTLEQFSAHIGVALENTRLVSDLEKLFLGTVRTLSKTIDAKSPWTRGHSERVTEIAIRIARVMGLEKEELRDLELSGLLHDIGKIATYEGILDKAGRLTDKEYKQIQKHPVKGAEILSPLKQLKDIIPGVRYHHVWYNGQGYPDEGLSKKSLPLFARILAVADTIDAMSADRPYRKGRSIEDVTKELKRCSGTQFDPDVVSAFLSTIENSLCA